MEAKTFRINAAFWSQALELGSGGAVLLVSNRNDPHRYCANMEAAKKVAEWDGTPVPWSESNPAKADDNWNNLVTIKGDKLAAMIELSKKTYDEPEAQAEAKAAELVEINKLDAKNAADKAKISAIDEETATLNLEAAKAKAADREAAKLAAAETEPVPAPPTD